MSAAAATADASADAKPKKSKKLLFIIIGVVVLALVGGGAAFFLLKKNHSEDGGEDGAPAAEAAHEPPPPPKHDPKAPPTFLPLDAMVVNLADEGGNRFVQLAITLQLDDPKVAEDMKVYMPAIRNGILLLISQRTAEQMLVVQGKEDLTQDIIGEISAVMGYDYEDPRADEAAADAETPAKGKKPKRKRAVYNPIRGVLFSSFIVQ
ncbi:MAG: flagellar basal body-associated FliL family protein [Hydrogenophaga sp.]|uniref:flagellar basal body-associated FliL family protein n=1 Tax=Hydrogenophaga sp. TaxID=1904254 RepID=UPI003D9BA707